jgi:hypothetical protein
MKLVICDKSQDYCYEGPRFKSLGPSSGEEFRELYLIPWLDSLSEGEKGIIDFARTKIYTPSFLEEAFGGAIRENIVNRDKLKNILFINITDFWEKKLKEYIKG